MRTDNRAGRERNRRRLALALATGLALAGLSAVTPALADYFDGITAYENRDYATAHRELQPLADRGDARAQRLVGLMYRDGLGVRTDAIRAYMWFDLAAQRGQNGAAELRDDLGQRIPAWQVEEAKKMVATWPQPQTQPPAQAYAGPPNPSFDAEDLPPATNYRGPMPRQQIADLQWQLAVHGYDPGASDGSVGPRTQQAIQHYQADAGLPVDGQPSPTLLEHLQYTDPPILNRQVARNNTMPPSQGAPSYGNNGPYGDQGSYDDQGPYEGQDPYANQGPYGDQGPYADQGYDQDGYDDRGQQPYPPPQPWSDVGAAPSLMTVYTFTVQEELARRGYDPGRIDGEAGGRTRAAIRQYQADNGLPATGAVSLELVNHLRLVTTAAAPAY